MLRLLIVLLLGSMVLYAPHQRHISFHEARLILAKHMAKNKSNAHYEEATWHRLKTCEVITRGLLLGTGAAHYFYEPQSVRITVATLFATGVLWCCTWQHLKHWEYDYKAAALNPPIIHPIPPQNASSLENKGDPTPEEISSAQHDSYKGIVANTLLTLATAAVPIFAVHRYTHGQIRPF